MVETLDVSDDTQASQQSLARTGNSERSIIKRQKDAGQQMRIAILSSQWDSNSLPLPLVC
jgi:hypothetical protein